MRQLRLLIVILVAGTALVGGRAVMLSRGAPSAPAGFVRVDAGAPVAADPAPDGGAAMAEPGDAADPPGYWELLLKTVRKLASGERKAVFGEAAAPAPRDAAPAAGRDLGRLSGHFRKAP